MAVAEVASNMLPAFAALYAGDDTSINPEAFSESRLSLIGGADRPYIAVRQLGVAAMLALTLSALANFVRYIVQHRSKKKMGRVAARRVVASVKDLLPFWDCASEQLKCYAMGSILERSANLDFAVSERVSGAAPVPACICRQRGDIAKPQRHQRVSCGLLPPANAPALSGAVLGAHRSVRSYLKGFGASRADSGNALSRNGHFTLIRAKALPCAAGLELFFAEFAGLHLGPSLRGART